jgi:acyl dehydratase
MEAMTGPGAPPADHTVVAFNTATASTNRIHDDGVAQAYGFRGGLVPGVDVYAYLTHIPVREWGRAWLEHGSMTARFVAPVYDGRTVTVSGTWDGAELAVSVDDGDARCATGRAGRVPPATDRPAPPAAAVPAAPPPAAADALRPGTVLGSIVDVFDADDHAQYLADVRETLPLYAADGIAHPGWLLRFANSALSRNVVLGPWIHVSSELALLGAVGDGETVEARAVVLDEFERKGHRFVTLDVAIAADTRPVQRITHTAIYRPRRLAD